MIQYVIKSSLSSLYIITSQFKLAFMEYISEYYYFIEYNIIKT